MSAAPAAGARGGRPWRLVQALFQALLLVAALGLAFSRLPHPVAILAFWPPWADIGALACGMTAVIVSGGIDLSVGAVIALCGAVLGLTWQRLGWPFGLCCGAAVLTGAATGALNGALVALGIAPFMVTLATMAGFSSLALALEGDEPITAFPAAFTRLGRADFLGVPSSLWLLLAVALTWGVLLHRTRLGRTLFAIGDNRTAAEFAALPVARRLWWLYTLNGLVAGVVALSTAARGEPADPTAVELQVIAAVVLGGTRVSGRVGGILRTLLGVAILAHLEIGLHLLDKIKFRLPDTQVEMVLNEDGRLAVIGILLIAVAVLNERAGGGREET